MNQTPTNYVASISIPNFFHHFYTPLYPTAHTHKRRLSVCSMHSHRYVFMFNKRIFGMKWTTHLAVIDSSHPLIKIA